jgi:hypothetical protein
VLTVSAVVLVPKLPPADVAALIALVAVWGDINAARSALGILALRRADDPPHWTDFWAYGIGPALAYFGLLGVAVALWSAASWSVYALAVLLLVLMLTALRNAWDLITWIAPMREGPPAAG